MLTAQQAFAHVWPQIISWLKARKGSATREGAAARTESNTTSRHVRSANRRKGVLICKRWGMLSFKTSP